MGGGGGSAGKIRYPAYIETAHNRMLEQGETLGLVGDPAKSLQDVMYPMIGDPLTNPYDSVSAFDPTADLDSSLARVNLAAFDIDQMGTAIVAQVNTFERQHRLRLARSVNRVAAQFADVNAVISTAYPHAMALLEMNYNIDVRTFQENAEKEQVRLKLQFVGIQLDYTRTRIAAFADQIIQDTMLNENEESWDLDVLLRGSSMLGAIAGVSPINNGKGLSQGNSILSGMALGASTGLQMFPESPAISGGVGAGIGGLLGAFS